MKTSKSCSSVLTREYENLYDKNLLILELLGGASDKGDIGDV